jgi:hypothetical protein
LNLAGDSEAENKRQNLQILIFLAIFKKGRDFIIIIVINAHEKKL